MILPGWWLLNVYSIRLIKQLRMSGNGITYQTIVYFGFEATTVSVREVRSWDTFRRDWGFAYPMRPAELNSVNGVEEPGWQTQEMDNGNHSPQPIESIQLFSGVPRFSDAIRSIRTLPAVGHHQISISSTSSVKRCLWNRTPLATFSWSGWWRRQRAYIMDNGIRWSADEANTLGVVLISKDYEFNIVEHCYHHRCPYYVPPTIRIWMYIFLF